MLQFEQRSSGTPDPGSDSAGTSAVLIDAKTGRVLVDCTGWPFSDITENPDGTLFLRLRSTDGETLFRIDPATGRFRDQGENGPDQALVDMGATIERLLQVRAASPPSPNYRRISPDGTIRIDLVAVEWGNSHWVYSPRVTDIASGRVVLDLWNTDWDATVTYPCDRRVSLDFRRYHYSGDLTIELDLANDLYRIVREPGGGAEIPEGPLSDAANAMEASGRRLAARSAAARPTWGTAPGAKPWAAWRSALVILAAAAAAIAGATALSLHFTSKPAERIILQVPPPKP